MDHLTHRLSHQCLFLSQRCGKSLENVEIGRQIAWLQIQILIEICNDLERCGRVLVEKTIQTPSHDTFAWK